MTWYFHCKMQWKMHVTLTRAHSSFNLDLSAIDPGIFRSLKAKGWCGILSKENMSHLSHTYCHIESVIVCLHFWLWNFHRNAYLNPSFIMDLLYNTFAVIVVQIIKGNGGRFCKTDGVFPRFNIYKQLLSIHPYRYAQGMYVHLPK